MAREIVCEKPSLILIIHSKASGWCFCTCPLSGGLKAAMGGRNGERGGRRRRAVGGRSFLDCWRCLSLQQVHLSLRYRVGCRAVCGVTGRRRRGDLRQTVNHQPRRTQACRQGTTRVCLTLQASGGLCQNVHFGRLPFFLRNVSAGGAAENRSTLTQSSIGSIRVKFYEYIQKTFCVAFYPPDKI